MRFLKYHFLVATIILIALIVAACGSTGSTPASPTATTSSALTATPTATPTPPATPTPTPNSANALVHSAQVSVKGTMETVLTDAAGKTLYYLTSDTATMPACTGQCTTFWPPLLAKGTPTSSLSLPHMLSVLNDANGQQVEYDSHLLYTFSGDTAADQANGEGIQGFGGIWHVATPNL